MWLLLVAPFKCWRNKGVRPLEKPTSNLLGCRNVFGTMWVLGQREMFSVVAVCVRVFSPPGRWESLMRKGMVGICCIPSAHSCSGRAGQSFNSTETFSSLVKDSTCEEGIHNEGQKVNNVIPFSAFGPVVKLSFYFTCQCRNLSSFSGISQTHMELNPPGRTMWKNMSSFGPAQPLTCASMST